MKLHSTALILVVTGCAISDPETSSLSDDITVWQWQDDVAIPSQDSAYQLGLASFGGRVHMVHNGSSNTRELWWSKFNGETWSTNVRFRTSSRPADLR